MKKILIFTIIIFVSINKINATNENKILPISEGEENAKIEILVYESLSCSHCAKFHEEVYPKLKKEFIDKGIVKIAFKYFPLDMAALNASKIAQCKNDGKSDLLHDLFKNQQEWVKGQNIEDFNQNLIRYVNTKEKDLDLKACLVDKDIEDHILNDRINGVKKYEVEATPTLIINDKKFDNPQNYKKLKKTLEKMI